MNSARFDTTTRRVPLAVVLNHYRPGSYSVNAAGEPWSWEDEEAYILALECLCCGESGGYQLHLEAYLQTRGRVEQGICLGNDGRVWDGHHRTVAARRLGFTDLPLEDESYAPEVAA